MKKGFTLSEVLIVLGIVGVISALTIPAIMKDYKQRIYISQLKKAYSQLSDSAQAIMSDEYSTNFYNTNGGVPSSCSNGKCTKGPAYFLNTYFKAAKSDCGAGKGNTCVDNEYKNIEGKDAGAIPDDYYCVQTTNSISICGKFDPDYAAQGSTVFIVDVNGLAEPNITGRDIYAMRILANGLIVDVDENKENCNIESSGDGPANYASGCLARIMEDNWQMKY